MPAIAEGGKLTDLANVLVAEANATEAARLKKGKKRGTKVGQKMPRRARLHWVPFEQGRTIPEGTPVAVRVVEGGSGPNSTHWYSYTVCESFSYILRAAWGRNASFLRLE